MVDAWRYGLLLMSRVDTLLMVTRERADDRRFGLGRSLDPLVAELHRQGIQVIYLSQEDAGQRGLRLLQRWHPYLVRLLGWAMRDTEAAALLGGVLERLNMGRLAAKVAFREKVSHVHCHDPLIAGGFQWFRWWYGGWSARQVRHGVTEHGFGSYAQALHEDGAALGGRVMRWLRAWERRILARCDWVMTPTEAGRRQLARDLAVYPLPSHWHVVPHPLGPMTFPGRVQARRQLGWAPEWFVVLAVGRHVPLKRFQDLIRACARLQDPNLHLVLLGPGDDPELRRFAREAGLAPETLHLAATPEPAAYYAGADVYVSTSATESFGLANLEAMAAGLPLLVTAVGGVPEVVGEAAWLVPPAQPALVAKALARWRDHPDERLSWAARARARARCWPRAVQVAEVYRSIYVGEGASRLTMGEEIQQEGETTAWSVYPLPAQLEPWSGRVLVIAPHPDDETLGIGGTIAAVRARGGTVRVVVVTDGAQGDPERRFSMPTATFRTQELQAALAVLGVTDWAQWHEPDGGCRARVALQRRFRRELETFAPDVILVPSPLDRHRDHALLAEAVLLAWLTVDSPARLFTYEITQPVMATHVVVIDDIQWRKKRRALAAYRLPLSYCDYGAMMENLMRYRALCLMPEAERVEAFQEIPRAQAPSLLAAMRRLRAQLS